jgi:Spy/CpxP family protein refolding chaperone
MRKASMVVVGMAVMSLISAMVYAEPRLGMGWKSMMEDGPGMLLPLMLKGVELTPKQDNRVHEIMVAHRATFRTLFNQLRAANEELADKLFAAGEVQPEDLTPQIEQITRLRQQLLQEGLKIALEVRGVLTPEQRAKAAQLKERVRALRVDLRHLLTEFE